MTTTTTTPRLALRAAAPGLLDDIARKEFLLDDAAAELSAIIADYVSGK